MTRLIVILVVFGSLAAACGSDDDTGSSATEPQTTATSAPAATVPALVSDLDRRPVPADAPLAEWVNGVNAAGWRFHRTLDGNAVSSPLSIGTAFSLARAGASPDTGTSLDAVFGFPADGVHDAANAVDQSLAEASASPNTVVVANRLFPDIGASIRQPFVDTAVADYGATVQPLDMGAPEAAADEINAWVSEETRGLIPVIVQPGDVANTELVLVNTVYLKADWALPFLPEFTTDRRFMTTADTGVDVPFMNDRIPADRRFVRLDGADAVELPYVRGEMVMWLIVPTDIDGLPAVEAALDAAAIVEFDDRAEMGSVDLSMPKWVVELPPTSLFSWLCPESLCPGAPFDGIAPGLFIDTALHGAKVIVDEKGTEAAAATALGFDASGPPPPDLEVVADRPFLWAITHPETDALLFLGRVVDPSA